MKMAERAPAAAASFKPKARLWRPEILVSHDGRDTTEVLDTLVDDRYTAVDDIGSQIVVLRVSRWPNVDGWGRLAFPRGRGFPVTLQVLRDEFQARIDSERLRHSQAAPDRLVRVGDVFLLRGPASPPKPQDAEIWDISAAGRDVAKAAYYGAGAATVDQDYIDQMGAVPAAAEMEAAPAGTFDIRQQALPSQGQAKA